VDTKNSPASFLYKGVMKAKVSNFKLFMPVFAGLLLFHCSLNLQDPQDELDDAVNSPTQFNQDNITGEWEAVSYQEVDDDEPFTSPNIKLEILRDLSYLSEDPSQRLFGEKPSGTVSLKESNGEMKLIESETGDTLHLKVSLTFLGNYLKVTNSKNGTVVHFEKTNAPKSEEWPVKIFQQNALNSKVLWEFKSWRTKDDEVLNNIFEKQVVYFVFSEDSLTIQTSRSGIRTDFRYLWEVTKDSLIIIDPEDDSRREAYLLDNYNGSRTSWKYLRLWPVEGHDLLNILELPSSPFDFINIELVEDANENFLNFNFLMGYWRSDTLRKSGDIFTLTHFESFYDLEFGPEGSISVTSNEGNELPGYSGWSIGSGKIFWRRKRRRNRNFCHHHHPIRAGYDIYFQSGL